MSEDNDRIRIVGEHMSNAIVAFVDADEPTVRRIITQAVELGALILDQYGPEFWWHRVDLATLDMNNRCILDQIYEGHYIEGMTKLVLDHEPDNETAATKMVAFGYEWPHPGQPLATAWKQYIATKLMLESAIV